MRSRIALVSFVCGLALTPGLASGDTLFGAFAATDKTAAAGTNDACLVANGGRFETFGFVRGDAGGCTALLGYATDSLNQVALSSISSGQSVGTAKMRDNNFGRVFIELFGAGCAAPYSGTASPDKCKVRSVWKGATQTSGPDSFTSGKVNVSCELGAGGSQLTPVPTAAQVDAFVAAFAGRSDVAVEENGKVKVVQKSVAGGDACDI